MCSFHKLLSLYFTFILYFLFISPSASGWCFQYYPIFLLHICSFFTSSSPFLPMFPLSPTPTSPLGNILSSFCFCHSGSISLLNSHLILSMLTMPFHCEKLWKSGTVCVAFDKHTAGVDAEVSDWRQMPACLWRTGLWWRQLSPILPWFWPPFAM